MSRKYFSPSEPKRLDSEKWKCWRINFVKENEAEAIENEDYCTVDHAVNVCGVSWVYLGNGAFNVARSATITSDLCIENVTYPAGMVVVMKTPFPAVSTNGWCDKTDRLAARWNEIYPDLPKAVADQQGHLFMPFIEPLRDASNNEIRPTYDEIIGELIRIYETTGRIVADAFVESNWIKSKEGRIICIDVGGAVRVHPCMGRSPSPDSQRLWQYCGDGYRQIFNDPNALKTAKIVNVTKALFFMQARFPQFNHLAFLKTPELVGLLLKMKNDINGVYDLLMTHVDEFASFYISHIIPPRDSGWVNNCMKSYRFSEKQVAQLHCHLSLTPKHLQVYTYLKNCNKLHDEAVNYILGLNEAQLNVVLKLSGVLDARVSPFHRKYLEIRVSFTESHEKFWCQHASVSFPVSKVHAMMNRIDEERLSYFDQIYQRLPNYLKNHFWKSLETEQQTNSGREFIDSIVNVCNEHVLSLSSEQLIIFIRFYTMAPIGFKSHPVVGNSVINAFAGAGEEMVRRVHALGVVQLTIVYKLIYHQGFSGDYALKAIPCFTLHANFQMPRKAFIDALMVSQDPDIQRYARSERARLFPPSAEQLSEMGFISGRSESVRSKSAVENTECVCVLQ